MTGEIFLGAFIGFILTLFGWLVIRFYQSNKAEYESDLDKRIDRKIQFAIDEYDNMGRKENLLVKK